MLDQILQWDQNSFTFLNSLGNNTYDYFWLTVTSFYSWVWLYILFLFLFFRTFSLKKAFTIIATFIFLCLFVYTLVELTKINVMRLRPNNTVALYDTIRAVQTPKSYGFFSGHATSTFAIATMGYLFLKSKFKLIPLLFLWPCLVAYSRIYVGVHYPSDVVVGMLVGITSGWFVFKLYLLLVAPNLVSSEE